MVISPPFLNAASPAAVYDAQQILQAMVGGIVGAGAFKPAATTGSTLNSEDVRSLQRRKLKLRNGGQALAITGSRNMTRPTVLAHIGPGRMPIGKPTLQGRTSAES